MSAFGERVKSPAVFVDDGRTWQEKFKEVCDSGITDQANTFGLRFTVQFTYQGMEAKEVVEKIEAVEQIFTEKTKNSEGHSLKYAGVEFGDVLNEFLPGNNMTFIQRKKEFNPFDLDGNGYVDVVEFLLYLFKDKILDGYKIRHGLSEVAKDDEATALMQEACATPVLVTPKLDEDCLGLAKLKKEYEEKVQTLKDEAMEAGGVKKIQLGNNLAAEEKKYEEAKKGFMSEDQMNKKKGAIQKLQEKVFNETKELLAKERADAAKPKRNLKKP